MAGIDTKWFTDKLADKRMSQRQLAKHLGLDSSAVSLTFRGKREMKLTEAAQIAHLIGVPVSDVLHHAGVIESTQGTKVSVAGIFDEHGELYCVEDTSESFDVPAPPGMTDHHIAIQARTSGGAFEHMDGWLMFLRYPRAVNPECIGKFCAVSIKNGIRTLAYVKRGYRPNRYNLSGPFNATDVELTYAEPIEQIKT